MAKKMGEDREGIVFEKQEKRDFPEEGDHPRQILFRNPGPLRTEAFAVLSDDAFGGSNLELGLEGWLFWWGRGQVGGKRTETV